MTLLKYVGVPGEIRIFAGSTPPVGWALCDGASFSTTANAALFAAIGYTYGGAGANFNVPDFRGRFPLGKSSAGTGSTLGATGGAIDHTHGSPLTTGAPWATVTATPLLVASASGTHTHGLTVPADNPPFLAVNFIIKT